MPQVELLGLAQRYAGCSQLRCAGSTLEQVLCDIAAQCPGFAARCRPGELLPEGLIVCVNERRFTHDPLIPILPDDRVLLLSADIGG